MFSISLISCQETVAVSHMVYSMIAVSPINTAKECDFFCFVFCPDSKCRMRLHHMWLYWSCDYSGLKIQTSLFWLWEIFPRIRHWLMLIFASSLPLEQSWKSCSLTLTTFWQLDVKKRSPKHQNGCKNATCKECQQFKGLDFYLFIPSLTSLIYRRFKLPKFKHF